MGSVILENGHLKLRALSPGHTVWHWRGSPNAAVGTAPHSLLLLLALQAPFGCQFGWEPGRALFAQDSVQDLALAHKDEEDVDTLTHVDHVRDIPEIYQMIRWTLYRRLGSMLFWTHQYVSFEFGNTPANISKIQMSPIPTNSLRKSKKLENWKIHFILQSLLVECLMDCWLWLTCLPFLICFHAVSSWSLSCSGPTSWRSRSPLQRNTNLQEAEMWSEGRTRGT